MKLTGTNCSIDLIVYFKTRHAQRQEPGDEPDIVQAATKLRQGRSFKDEIKTQQKSHWPLAVRHPADRRGPTADSASIDGLVAMAGAPAPDPIPNSAVKAPSADGTAS